jgi:hypothetical protein
MDKVTYILKGFGFSSLTDYLNSLFSPNTSVIILSASLATLRVSIFSYTGLDVVVIAAFVFLIIAEFQTGIRVSMSIKMERFKSRKFGRMILKIGTYISIVVVLHTFSKRMEVPNVLGFDINPFLWLYYMVFTAIVFQLFISWMENLGCLGYKETKSIAGFVLRKFNKWFEFDGKKDNGDN